MKTVTGLVVFPQAVRCCGKVPGTKSKLGMQRVVFYASVNCLQSTGKRRKKKKYLRRIQIWLRGTVGLVDCLGRLSTHPLSHRLLHLRVDEDWLGSRTMSLETFDRWLHVWGRGDERVVDWSDFSPMVRRQPKYLKLSNGALHVFCSFMDSDHMVIIIVWL